MSVLDELGQQWKGVSLPQLIQHQIKTLKEERLIDAIQGTYDNFPTEYRSIISDFTLAYAKKWFSPAIKEIDLSDLLTQTINDIKDLARDKGFTLSDDQLFDVFNIMVMRVSHFAHSQPSFRKELGIKKGWFS